MQLAQNILGDLRVEGGQGQALEPGGGRFNGEFTDLHDILPRQFDEPGGRFQTAAVAGRAGGRTAVAAEQHAHMELVAFGFQIVEVLPDSFDLIAPFPDQLLHLFGKLLKRGRQIHALFLHRQQYLLLPPVRSRLAPRLDDAAGKRFAPVGDDQIFVVLQDIAEPFALRAGSERVVEGEQQRA